MPEEPSLMNQIVELIETLLPLLGVLIGAWLTYLLNRKAQDRNLMLEKISATKVDLYEKLYQKFSFFNQNAQEAFNYAKKNDIPSLGVALKNSETAALGIMNFFDENELYIDRDVILQVGATCMIPAGLNIDPKSKNHLAKVDDLYEKYVNDYRDSVEIIKEYMGLKRIEKHLKVTNKPKTNTHILDYARQLEKSYEKKKP